jgi:hypothetical protein
MRKDIEAVNDVLFDTLQKLQDNKIEIPKAKAIIDTAGAIAKNASLQLQAFKLTKGKTAAPKTLIQGKVYATLGNGDTHSQKVEFATSLGYKDLSEAFADIGTYEFNKKFKQEFDIK